MEVRVSKNRILTVKHKLKRTETYKLGEGSKFQTVSIYKKPQIVSGISSATEDSHDVLFIDYDDVEQDVIERDYSVIQKKFKLPQGYLFKNKNNSYHVICLKKFLPRMVYTILSYTHCDSVYVSLPLRNKYRGWVLRISNKKGSGKPRFIKLVGDNEINYEGQISNAHMKALSKLYLKLKHPKYLRIDKFTKIKLQKYET